MNIGKRGLWYRVFVVICAVVLSGSALITANERYLHCAVIPSWMEIYAAFGFVKPAVPNDELHVTVLDVGEADCLLLQSGGKHVLIDAGEEYTAEYVVDSLHAAGVTRLDCIVATHFDEDHIGGMADVVRQFECDRLWVPTFGVDSEQHEGFFTVLREKRVNVIPVDLGEEFLFGNASMTVINEQSERFEETDKNANSIVCRVTFGSHAFLFMADAPAEVEQDLLNGETPIKADVIKVSHHGSGDASDAAFIAAVDPTYAVISCNSAVSKFHPHKDTLQTLTSCGAQIYRTDVHGKILIRSDGTELSVTGEYK